MGRCPCWLIVGAAVLSARAQAQAPPPGRPAALGVQANIVFLHYRDIPAAPPGSRPSACSATRTRGRFGVQKHFGV
jgi:hypothetical protein